MFPSIAEAELTAVCAGGVQQRLQFVEKNIWNLWVLPGTRFCFSGLCFHFSSLRTQFQNDKLSVDLHNVVFPRLAFSHYFYIKNVKRLDFNRINESMIHPFHTTVLLWCIFHLSPLYKQGSILSFGCGAATMLPVHLPSCLFLRNLYEHMQRGCSLVPFWHPEVWAEVRLLDVWRLVAGPPDERCWHLKLHAQWRMGPNRWVWWNFYVFLSSSKTPSRRADRVNFSPSLFFQGFPAPETRSSMIAVRSLTQLWRLLWRYVGGRSTTPWTYSSPACCCRRWPCSSLCYQLTQGRRSHWVSG